MHYRLQFRRYRLPFRAPVRTAHGWWHQREGLIVRLEEADRSAVVALGDAKTANHQYRNVLLTSAEARLLNEGNWEARAVCSIAGLKWMLLAAPVSALVAATVLFLMGNLEIARVLLSGGIGMGLVFGAPFLPVYTPRRSRIFRWAKWIVIAGVLRLAFGPDALKWSWLLFSCLWPMAWVEWRRVSIRRKLPVGQWPMRN